MHNLPTAQDITEQDLTDANLWKPIYEEMLRLQEQRAISKNLVLGVQRV